MRHINLLTTVLCASGIAECGDTVAQAKRPNILLITTDQQSYTAISALRDSYSPDMCYFETPNIDRIVRSGVSFTNAYCANPVSVPSRFSLYTGTYGSMSNVRHNNCFAKMKPGEHVSTKEEVAEVCEMISQNGMGNVFKKAGYETIYAGKIHLPLTSTENDREKNAPPTEYGFDNYLTEDRRDILGSEVADFINERDNNSSPFLMAVNFINPHDICYALSYIDGEYQYTGNDPEIKDVLERINNKRQGYSDELFFGSIAPHKPFNMASTDGFGKDFTYRTPKPPMRKEPINREYRYYYQQMTNMVDVHIGKILDALDANPELKDNTIIIFTSDHGDMQGAHAYVAKNLPYEECQRIPFIFAGAGVNGKNIRESALVCNGVDLLPTMCEMAGVEMPPVVQGVSLAGYVSDKVKEPKPRKFLYTDGDGFSTIIKGKYKYTYVDIPNIPDESRDLLVDISKDRGEMRNIAPSEPKRVAEMKTDMESYQSKIYQK